MMDPKLQEILVCPECKGPLKYVRETEELWCIASGLAYAVRDGIPVMLSDEARELTDAERSSMT